MDGGDCDPVCDAGYDRARDPVTVGAKSDAEPNDQKRS